MRTSICYAHAKFKGNPSVFGRPIAKNKRENYIWPKKLLQFLEVPDYLQKKHGWIRHQQLNQMDTNIVRKDQPQKLT